MRLQFNNEFIRNYAGDRDVAAIAPEVLSAFRTLNEKNGAGNDFLGWRDLPVDYDQAEFSRILAAAEKIKKSCDILVVIGIGGSYLGARAAIEFIKSPFYNDLPKDTPSIYFAGNNVSASALRDILTICDGKDICVNVISKSGTTTEPAVAFRVFRDLLEKKYGKDGARERIFVTTDRARGTLKQFSDASGYETFVIPDDVGGRFSVLTAVGLLPMAVAGIDIRAVLEGAAEARADFTVADLAKNEALLYAAYRHLMLRSGKTTEILVGYEPFQTLFGEWWKQLYGESEGKDNKGIFPASSLFTTDLHSLGQFIQDGTKNLFETVIAIENQITSFPIPNDENNVDGLNFLTGMELERVNKNAMLATLCAHSDGGVPNILLTIPDRSAATFGYLVYFFMLSCAVSAYTLGVNPFNQPGVESYKKLMYALLGKPGYEEQRAALKKRLSVKN